MMQSVRYGLLLAASALCLAQGPALANICYFVYDRNDNVIYRDQQPPVDMSDRGAAARDAMRQRGEYLLFAESDRCAPLAFLTGPGTPGTLSVDQIVAGYPAMAKPDPNSSPISRSTTGGAATSRAASSSKTPASSSAYKK
jgi:hypothetical protein